MIKEEMYELFIKACEMCNVEFSETDFNGKTFKKPKRAWYNVVGQEVLAYVKDDSSFNNVPDDYKGYLREYFKRLTRDMQNRHKAEVGYNEVDMKPFFSFVHQRIGHKPAVKLDEKILYSSKVFSYFNFWRIPESGYLTKTMSNVIFDGKDVREIFSRDAQVKVMKMPPAKGSWVMLTDGKVCGYLAVSDGLGKIKSPERLLSFLESQLDQSSL